FESTLTSIRVRSRTPSPFGLMLGFETRTVTTGGGAGATCPARTKAGSARTARADAANSLTGRQDDGRRGDRARDGSGRARVELGHHGGSLAALLDDPERLVLGDDLLDLEVDVTRRNEEPPRVRADVLVVGHARANPLSAGLVGAFAREFDHVVVAGRPLAGEEPDALVHLPEQRLVAGKALPAFAVGGRHVTIVTGAPFDGCSASAVAAGEPTEALGKRRAGRL